MKPRLSQKTRIYNDISLKIKKCHALKRLSIDLNDPPYLIKAFHLSSRLLTYLDTDLAIFLPLRKRILEAHATVCEKMKRYDDAISCWKKIIDLDLSDWKYWLCLVTSYRLQGEFAAMEPVFNKFFLLIEQLKKEKKELSAGDKRSYAIMLTSYAIYWANEAGERIDPIKAIKYAKEATKVDNLYPAGWATLAKYARINKDAHRVDFKEIERCYNKAYENDPFRFAKLHGGVALHLSTEQKSEVVSVNVMFGPNETKPGSKKPHKEKLAKTEKRIGVESPSESKEKAEDTTDEANRLITTAKKEIDKSKKVEEKKQPGFEVRKNTNTKPCGLLEIDNPFSIFVNSEDGFVHQETAKKETPLVPLESSTGSMSSRTLIKKLQIQAAIPTYPIKDIQDKTLQSLETKTAMRPTSELTRQVQRANPCTQLRARFVSCGNGLYRVRNVLQGYGKLFSSFVDERKKSIQGTLRVPTRRIGRYFSPAMDRVHRHVEQAKKRLALKG